MSVRRSLTIVLAVLAGLYTATLLVVSLASRTVVLPKGEPLRFCGAYLDCHLTAVIRALEVQPGRNGGLRYRVIVRFSSDAKEAMLPIRDLQAVLLAPGGVRLRPVAAPRYLEIAAGQSLDVDFVFNSLDPVMDPVLQLTQGHRMSRLAEKVLIGDPDSFLHKPVLLALR